jgi:hypothetical protein
MSLTDDDKLWLTERMDALEQRIAKHMDALVTEPPKSSSLIEQKLRSLREALSAPDPEIEPIGKRVPKLEADRERPH